MSTISVIIPTLNEAAYLERALYSVQFADEIIIIDSMSTDETLAIARTKGCQIIQRKFDNFSNQKNYALSYATCDWVLFLDADERITYPLQLEILEAVKTNHYNGYKLKFPHFFMNRFLFQQSSSVLRLVRKNNCHFEGSVHEKLIVEGSVGLLKNPVLHYTYKGLEHYLNKKDKYAWFQAQQLYDKGKKVTFFHLFFKPLYRFVHSFIFRGGFKEGVPAFAIAAANAYGVFSRYAKLILIKKKLK